MPHVDYSALQDAQRRRLEEAKAGRDEGSVARALDAVAGTAESDSNLLPVLIEAVKVRATLGEISQRLRQLWGAYRAV